jgi:hypothetical protein
MHDKIVKYLEAIQLINEAERDHEEGSEPTEQIRLAYQQAEAAWADIPVHIRKNLTPPPPLP